MQRTTHIGAHAVVIGGSMAGLLAARALSEHFAAVTIVERDRLPDGPEQRKGVPQARHVHAFWAGGLAASERLLPGLRAELVAAGAVPLRMPTDMAWLTAADRWTQHFDATQEMVSASRTLLECLVRRRVRTVPNVHFVPEQDVTGLLLDDHGDVRGATVRDRRRGEVLELTADLVVDASGRGSALPQWLAALGLATPKETVVDGHLGYASRVYETPEDPDRGWKAAYVQAAPPRHTRGGILFPIEGNRWLITLIGGAGDFPSTEENGYLDFARSLRDPLISDAIASAEPVSPIFGFRRTANRRRHYEKTAMPGRLLVIGDSLCAFNPVYGQGMTVAAKEVQAMDSALRERGAADRLVGVIRRAQRDVARCIDGPWTLSTSNDLRYPDTEGAELTLSTRLVNRYMDRVVAAVSDDEVVNAAFLRVLNMVDPPQALFHPRVAVRALRPARPTSDERPAYLGRPLAWDEALTG
jgi:2-polyprenyl-6-methoxyphenol hydroxylase-like FAD-dependent oxidoreductase